MWLIFKRTAGALSSEGGYVVAKAVDLKAAISACSLCEKIFFQSSFWSFAKSIASNVHPRSEILHTYHLWHLI